MPKSLKERLSKILIEDKFISCTDLEHAKQLQIQQGGSLGKILVKEGLIKEDDLMSIMSKELNIPIINLARYKIEDSCIKVIPEVMARQYKIIPICRLANTLIVAMADPLDIFALDDMKLLTKFNVEPVLSTETAIIETIDKCYGSRKTSLRDAAGAGQGKTDLEFADASIKDNFEICEGALEGEAPPIVKMVDLIIVEALKKRASDIHIESEIDNLKVRYRIDGNLQDVLTIPKNRQNAVLARIKIMSGMDITEYRLPQDGRFKVKLTNKEVDFRVSLLPTVFGGKIVLRALDKANLSIGLDSLGFSEYALGQFKEAVAKPFGMILVTGPTGSGKSTTLYSVLTQMNSSERNIITIEDPVEYQVEGITQIQVNADIGLTFANGLRSLLRQSPDIIMIGEIRDAETADIAIKASLTGQLVLSTIHTNDACSTISRLMDMGCEPFLIASSLVLIAAQRLCRVACKNCKGAGCKKCDSKGYYGRVAVLEVLLVDDKIREMIIDNVNIEKVKEYAVSKGMVTLHDDAVEKYNRGVTTMEEVIRVTSEE